MMKNSYLGDEYSDSFIKSELERYKLSYKELSREELLEATTEEIKNGNVIGWFQGKMEWGPRALGNRSILAHPGFPNMKDILNARIKHREAFRPFAPSVLQERQDDLFEQSIRRRLCFTFIKFAPNGANDFPLSITLTTPDDCKPWRETKIRCIMI